jgi:cellulose synthase/poly-beta-1,6-N-acetylglucosamine synthase-like glycosyltransferase
VASPCAVRNLFSFCGYMESFWRELLHLPRRELLHLPQYEISLLLISLYTLCHFCFFIHLCGFNFLGGMPLLSATNRSLLTCPFYYLLFYFLLKIIKVIQFCGLMLESECRLWNNPTVNKNGWGKYAFACSCW